MEAVWEVGLAVARVVGKVVATEAAAKGAVRAVVARVAAMGEVMEVRVVAMEWAAREAARGEGV